MANQVNNAPPVNATVDTLMNGRLSLSFAWKLWFNWLFNFVNNLVNYSNTTPYVAVTGFSYAVRSSQSVVTLAPAAGLSSGTVVLPPAPNDGQPIEISSTHSVATFTLSPSAGQTVMNAPTSLAAGVGVAFYYNAASATWFRRY